MLATFLILTGSWFLVLGIVGLGEWWAKRRAIRADEQHQWSAMAVRRLIADLAVPKQRAEDWYHYRGEPEAVIERLLADLTTPRRSLK